MTFQHILAPTDFSETARQALAHAVYLARQYDATLHVLHIEEVSDQYYEQDATLREQNEAQMRDLLAEVDTSGVRVEHVIDAGEVAAPGIIEHAEALSADLIVIGTHGRRGLKRLFMGSVAEEVVRQAPCPVLAVRTHDRPFPENAIRRILVPLDLSEHSLAALRYAKTLSADHGSRLEVLHVFEDIDLPGIYGDIENPLYDFPEARERVDAELRSAVEAAGGPDADVDYEIAEGRAADTIIDRVEEEPIDLVVITSHGQSGLERYVLGSVAEKVMQSAPCPVLVVKSFGTSYTTSDKL